MFTNMEIESFKAFLIETLIPDLRESGHDATADDFDKAVQIIEQLQSGIANLLCVEE